MSAERAPRRRLLAPLLLLAMASCLKDVGGPEGSVTSPRYLDQVCRDGRYRLEGAAYRTTGLTDDSCGFMLGPGTGRVLFTLRTEDIAGFASYELSALVAREGDGRVDWIPVEGAADDAGQGEPLFALDAPGRGVQEVIDLRLSGEYPDEGCSVARRRPRGRSFLARLFAR